MFTTPLRCLEQLLGSDQVTGSPPWSVGGLAYPGSRHFLLPRGSNSSRETHGLVEVSPIHPGG